MTHPCRLTTRWQEARGDKERGLSFLTSGHKTRVLRDMGQASYLASRSLVSHAFYVFEPCPCILFFNHFVGQKHDVLRRTAVVADKVDGLAFHGDFLCHWKHVVGLALTGQADDGHTNSDTRRCCIR